MIKILIIDDDRMNCELIQSDFYPTWISGAVGDERD